MRKLTSIGSEAEVDCAKAHIGLAETTSSDLLTLSFVISWKEMLHTRMHRVGQLAFHGFAIWNPTPAKILHLQLRNLQKSARRSRVF